jgi:ATP-dependent DNA helicase DinG
LNIFSTGGVLEHFLEGYQERKGQAEMADMLTCGLHTIEAPNILIAEGAVGVGKSLAYLFSSLIDLEGKLSKKRIIVSTSSITLQNQLEHKDLPFVQKVIRECTGENISFVSLKGITNYCCALEFERYANRLQAHYPDIYERYKDFRGSGEQPEEVDLEAWQLITTTHADCMGKDCDAYGRCYYMCRREAAKDVDVVIVNHALLAANQYLLSAFGRSILQPYDILIIDECHELESSVLNFVGETLSEHSLNLLKNKPEKVVERIGKVKLLSRENIFDVQNAFGIVRRSIEEFDWEGLAALVRRIDEENAPGQIIEQPYDTSPWIGHTSFILDRFSQLREEIHLKLDIPFVVPVDRYRDEFESLLKKLQWLRDPPEDVAIWTEHRKRGHVISLVPVNVAEFLEPIWGSNSKKVLTSATIMVDSSFKFIKQRLGIPLDCGVTLEGRFESPFDYQTQVTAFFVPTGFNPKEPGYDEKVLEGIGRVLQFSNYKKTMVLFTSHNQMRKIVPQIRLMYSDQFLILEQNPSMSKEFLLRKFRESDRVVLVAQAASFGTGVDIKGDKNIIIVKLSFDVPDDPIFKVKERMIKKKGQNPFADLSIPQVAIRTKQQVGRGIRSIEDKALVAIFDERLVKTRWGKRIWHSLPTAGKKYWDRI